MPRTIKKISHDLMPLSDASAETAALVCETLKKLAAYLEFDKKEVKECYNMCLKACEKMTISIQMVKKYVVDVDKEAEKEGITKD